MPTPSLMTTEALTAREPAFSDVNQTALTGQNKSTSGNAAYDAWPIALISAARNRMTEAFPAVSLVPHDALVLAVGQHNFLPMTAVVWLSHDRRLLATVESDSLDLGSTVLIRVWTRDASGINRAAEFQPWKGRSVAVAEFPAWDGLPVGGVVLFPLGKAGDEC